MTILTGTPAAAPPLSQVGMARLGLGLTYLAAATIPWTAVEIVGISAGEVLLGLAAAALLLADLDRRLPTLPPWVWAMSVAVLVIGVAHELAPPAASFLARRDVLYGEYVVHGAFLPDNNFSVMLHLILRLILLPVVFGLALHTDGRALFRTAMAFVAGVTVCSVVAFTDSRGWTSIGPNLLHIPIGDQRGAGLTDHPNVVAMICVLALPLAAWQLQAARGRARLLIAVAAAVMLLGLYASRSRSGAAAAALGILVVLLWNPRYRRQLANLALVATAGATILFVARPDLGRDVLSGLRLTGGSGSGSDLARTIVNDQAWRDFRYAPIHGVGLQVAQQAHVVYLQALATGGVILLAGLLIYLGGALVRAARCSRVHPIAIPLFAAVLAGAAFNALQNVLIASIAYLIPALVAVLPLPPPSADAAGTDAVDSAA